MQQAKLALLEIHINIDLPKNGEIIERKPINTNDRIGVLYWGCNFEKQCGIIYDSAKANIALLPPIRKDFQLVIIPHIPPIMPP